MFHLQIGTQNKTVLNFVISGQFGNELFHSQMGIRNKAVLKISIWERYVPLAHENSEQNSPNLPFGNNVFH